MTDSGVITPRPLPDRLAELMDLDPADRRDVDALLRRHGDRAEVRAAVAVLSSRLGAFPGDPAAGEFDDASWICAIVLFAGQTADWHSAHSVDASVTTLTMADIGRQFRLHRQTHGVFGLETWWFLTLHLAGSLFQLGRLQLALRPRAADETGLPGDPTWVLDVHIPPTGPLPPSAVDASFAAAVAFFGSHFPDRPVGMAVCSSWLLDPYLAKHLPEANISRFQQRFQRYGPGVPSQRDVLYFVFRTRDIPDLTHLPRETSLQRAVLDRIAAGGVWQSYRGFRTLPD